MKKVLVIDDDKDILEAVGLILENGGYLSKLANKGDEIYTMIASYKPDLIILDILLSGNDGRVICQKLKQNAETKNIPIIMISAHPNAKASVVECGADSFMAKPFSIDGLLNEVGKYIA